MGFEEQLRADIPRGLVKGQDKPAAAQWASPDELNAASWRFAPDHRGIFLGYRNGQPKAIDDDRHMMTVAGSRAGKGVSLVIPNLLLYRGSALVIDPKGELAAITKAERERMGQRCFVLDPFGANGRYPSAAYNPLAEIDPASPDAVDDAALIADSLILEEAKGASHWTDSAKLLLRGLVLLTLTLPKAERNLVTLRRLLMLAHPLLDGVEVKDKETRLFAEMALADSAAFNGVLAATGATFAAIPSNERGSILSTARMQTGFLDSPALQPTLQGDALRLADLKREKITVYLCLPASHMGTHARWLRIIINMAMTLFEREKTKPVPPVLLLLEEFAVLGHMQRIEVAAGQIAGFGVKLWTILQDLTQLQRHYRESWETFIGNAGVLTFFGNSDVTTCQYVSDKLGGFAYHTKEQAGVSMSAVLAGTPATRDNLRVDPLLAPHEIERVFSRATGRVLVLAQDHAPAILERAFYNHDQLFKGKFT